MDETITRQSSKLSLGSSPSILSGDEQLELDEPLSFFNQEELTTITMTQACSPLSLEETHSGKEDDNSSLSSAPDDLALSPSPECLSRKRRKDKKDINLKKPKVENLPELEVIQHTTTTTNTTTTITTATIEKLELSEIKQKEEEAVICEVAENDEDYQQKHKEALDALTHIELEFARLRDRMYQEKLSELNNEAMMIENGTHPELLSLMIEIQQKKEKRVNSAEAWRRYQYADSKRHYEGFEYQANIHFISQRNSLRRDVFHRIHQKKWDVENERKKANLPEGPPSFTDGAIFISYKKESKEETDELSQLKESVGFPMAPVPKGLHPRDIDEDLRLLGITSNS
ncbi:Sds3-like-domain-containing protein [Sporodiniella umbellata]|nr:Sds3-like-domain-containing protein [Sporodiniella umbellata]